MADTKISQLPAATAPTGTEVVPILQGGANKRATANELAAPAVAAHEAASDPHPQYLRQVEADALYATAAQGTDAREWTATTISQVEAEAGTATTRRAFTAERVFQAVAAWWAASAAKTKLDGIAAGAEVNVNADWNATSGDAQILNKPTIPAAADATPQAPGTAAVGVSTDYAREDHVHPLPAVVSTSAAGLAPATSFGTITYAADVELDLAVVDGQINTITLTGPLGLTTLNRANGRRTVLRLIPGASSRTLTFPVGWVFIGAKPASVTANKTAILSLTVFGTASGDVHAVYAEQS